MAASASNRAEARTKRLCRARRRAPKRELLRRGVAAKRASGWNRWRGESLLRGCDRPCAPRTELARFAQAAKSTRNASSMIASDEGARRSAETCRPSDRALPAWRSSHRRRGILARHFLRDGVEILGRLLWAYCPAQVDPVSKDCASTRLGQEVCALVVRACSRSASRSRATGKRRCHGTLRERLRLR